MSEDIKFIAILPPIQSAIQIYGNGDGARIKLDISGQYLNSIIKLQQLTNKRLSISIKEDIDVDVKDVIKT